MVHFGEEEYGQSKRIPDPVVEVDPVFPKSGTDRSAYLVPLVFTGK
jgi:hypothetical protein